MIGGDMFIHDYRFAASESSSDKVLHEEIRNGKSLNFFSALLFLINFSITYEPYYMHSNMKIGIAQFFIVSLFFMILSQMSFLVFVNLWRYNSSNSYSDIWETIFGKAFKIFPRLLVIISCLSITASITTEIASVLTDILKSNISGKASDIFLNQWTLLYGVSIITIVPFLTYTSSLRKLTVIAYISNVGLILSIIGLLIVMGMNIKDNGFDPNHQLKWWFNDLNLLMNCAASLISLYTIQPFVAPVVLDMKAPTGFTAIKLSWTSTLLSSIINLACGVAGYFILFDFSKQKNIFIMLSSGHPLVIACKVGVIIKLIGSNILYSFVAATEIKEIIIPGCDSAVVRFIVTLVVVFFNVILGFIGSVGVSVFNIIGSICFEIVGYILPPILYLSVFKFKNKWYGTISVVILILAIPVCCLVTYFSFANIF